MPKPVRSYLAEFEHRIAGIPCIIAVTYFHNTPAWRGSAHTCPSSEDYYGYTELEYDVLDRKGYKAAWLEKKVTADDETEINATALELLGGGDYDD